MKLSFQSPYVHIDLVVLAQKVDNRIVPKSPFKVMFYYQPLDCGTAQTFLFASLYCTTLPTECYTALKLPATFMVEHPTSCYKRLQTLPFRHFEYVKMMETNSDAGRLLAQVTRDKFFFGFAK